MEENFVPQPGHALVHGCSCENDTIILVPPETPGYRRFEAEMHLLMGVIGYPPAHLDAIDSLEVVIVSKEDEKEGGACPICLDDWEEGDVAKELPCKHWYHGPCIRKYCPVCKYYMPVDYGYVIKVLERYGGGFSADNEEERAKRVGG